MFCPSCGSEYTVGLKYCNRCGANLSNEMVAPPPPVVVNLTKPVLIVSLTMTVLTLGGFGSLVAGAIALAEVVHQNDPLIAMIMFGMITIMIIDVFLARQLSKLISASLTTNQTQSQLRPPQANVLPPQLYQPNTARLQQAPSVTENTTRFFEDYSGPAEAEVLKPVEKLK